MDNIKKKEYKKKRRSPKYIVLNKIFQKKLNSAKKNYYKKIVMDLKTSNPGQWFSKLKRMSNHDQNKFYEVICAEISELDDQSQSELIADYYERISNRYQPLKNEDIEMPGIRESTTPYFTPNKVFHYLKKIKTKTSTVIDDIPAIIIQEFAKELSVPFANIINCMIVRGEYPGIWKEEQVTPVPKVYPPEHISDLRKFHFLEILLKLLKKLYLTWL